MNNCTPNNLAPPSKNLRLLENGEAVCRLGYEATTWNLNQSGKKAMSHYMGRYNITFFALGTKVYYIEHDRNDAVVDTGITLTDGTVTRMDDYNGDLFLTNTTDGMRQIHVMRLNDSSPTSGDATVTVDQDGGGRLNAFSTTSGNLRIRGTNEAFTGVTTAGVVTLTGTLSQTYANDDIAIVVTDISSGRPFGSKLTFWKERMICIGVNVSTASDVASSTAFMSKFSTSTTAERVIAFGTTDSATQELIGKAGILTNIVATRDYTYFFKKDEVYYSSVADVDASSGATFPQLMSTNYGCVNEDCAIDLGSGMIAFLTNNKRIICIRIESRSGAPVVFPDESFDQPIRNTLALLDNDQSNAHMFYHRGARLLYVQVSVQGQTLTLVYDNTLKKWLPPDTNKVFQSYFEKNGVLYATDKYDDTIYEMDTGTTDNGDVIDYVFAHGQFDPTKGRSISEWEDIEITGRMTKTCTITAETSVDNGDSASHSITTSGVSFDPARGIGDVVIGDLVLGGSAGYGTMGEYAKRYRIAPTSYGLRYQTILSSNQPFTVRSFNIALKAQTESQLTLS